MRFADEARMLSSVSRGVMPNRSKTPCCLMLSTSERGQNVIKHIVFTVRFRFLDAGSRYDADAPLHEVIPTLNAYRPPSHMDRNSVVRASLPHRVRELFMQLR